MATCFHSWCGKARNNISQWETSALQSVHCFLGLISPAGGGGGGILLYCLDKISLTVLTVASFRLLLSVLGWIYWGREEKINIWPQITHFWCQWWSISCHQTPWLGLKTGSPCLVGQKHRQHLCRVKAGQLPPQQQSLDKSWPSVSQHMTHYESAKQLSASQLIHNTWTA